MQTEHNMLNSKFTEICSQVFKEQTLWLNSVQKPVLCTHSCNLGSWSILAWGTIERNFGAFLAHSWRKVGAFLAHSWRKVGAFLLQSWRVLGAKLAHSCCKVGVMLVQSFLTFYCTFTRRRASNFAPTLHQECTNFAPRMHQLCTKNAPTLHQECPTLHQFGTKNAPIWHQERTNFAPRMHQLCTKNAPTLHQEYIILAPSFHSNFLQFLQEYLAVRFNFTNGRTSCQKPKLTLNFEGNLFSSPHTEQTQRCPQSSQTSCEKRTATTWLGFLLEKFLLITQIFYFWHLLCDMSSDMFTSDLLWYFYFWQFRRATSEIHDPMLQHHNFVCEARSPKHLVTYVFTCDKS